MKLDFSDKKGRRLPGVSVRSGEGGLFDIYRIDESLIKSSSGIVTVRCILPILDIHGFWIPEMTSPRMKLDWNIKFSSAAHKNFPYISFFNLNQENRFSIGSTNLIDDSVVSARMNQETGNYEIEISVSVSGCTGEFEVLAGSARTHWPEMLAAYRRIVKPGFNPSYPDGAWLPVYCTWYAAHAAVEQKWLDEQAVAAGRLGFGTFILDDGWCFDDFKRVTPENITNWYEKIGDWEVSPEKLPDFKAHVERVKNLGLKYMLWVSPFMAGVRSRFYAETECDYLTAEHEGYRVFNPLCGPACAKILDRLSSLVREYGLDGLKIDFVDAVEQSLETPTGRAVYGFLRSLTGGIKEENPEALFEFRQKYDTPAMLHLATQFRAGDVPFDFIANINRIASIRLCLGDRVPVHADPVYWHPQESEANVARHMISSLAGVPMVSMDLNALSEPHSKIMRGWLDFYRDNLEVFKRGHWDIAYEFDRILYISVSHESEKIVFLTGETPLQRILSETSGNLCLLNPGIGDFSVPGCVSYDCFNEPCGEGILPSPGRADIRKQPDKLQDSSQQRETENG